MQLQRAVGLRHERGTLRRVTAVDNFTVVLETAGLNAN